MKKIGIVILAVLLVMTSSVVAYAADSATISYEDLKYVAGDVDCNESIEAADMVVLKKILMETVEAERVSTADTNGDDEINILDLIRLKNYFVDGPSVALGK